MVRLKSADRNIEVMGRYLSAAARTARSQMAAIGVAQEPQRVFIARQRDTDPSKPAAIAFDKKDRRVTVFYFYLWDTDFGTGVHQGLHLLPVADQGLAQRPRMGQTSSGAPVEAGGVDDHIRQTVCSSDAVAWSARPPPVTR